MTVDVTNAAFTNGVLADLTTGTYVEIKGHMVDGVLVATKVEFKTGAGHDFEDHGLDADFVSISSFTVNGVPFDATNAIFEHGKSVTDLSNGVYVEIKGALNADGVFVATKIEVKAHPPV